MFKPLVIYLILITVALSLGRGAQPQDQSSQLQAQAQSPIPPVYYDSLLNGLQIMIVERPDQSKVTIGFMIKSGAAFDLVGREGTADMTARLVLRGSQMVNDKSLTQQLQALDVEADSSVTWDATRFTFQSPARNLAHLLPILAEVLSRSTFPDSDIATVKQQRIDELRQRHLSPSALTAMELSRLVFARHPYARPVEGTVESIETITPTDMARHYRRFYLANNALLTVVGSVSAEAIMPLIRPTFGALRRGKIVPATFTAPARPNGIHIKIIDQADSPEAFIGLGYLTAARGSEDFIPLLLLNYALSGTNRSQLGRLVSLFAPEPVTLTSQLDSRALASSFSISATARGRLAPAVIAALLKLVESVRAEGVTPADLTAAKSFFIENRSTQLRTNRQIAQSLEEMELYGLGRDSIISFDQRIDKVTPEQIKKIAADYLSTTNLDLVIAGPSAEMADELKTIGTVEVVK
jgi:zinc protease